MAIHSIELCAGVGMFGEATRAAFDFLGIGHRTICYVEREAAAAGQLVTLMEAGILDPAPVWSDLLTFDGAAWRGKVDCLLAGFPCQDLSIAGRRSGLDGERSGLFFDICDLADDCGAQMLVLENVSAIVSATATVVDEAEELDERAAARVMGELADRGWDAEWITIRASDVGASHQRARWFCFAWRVADTERTERRPERVARRGGQQGHDGKRQAHGGSGIAESALADTGGERRQQVAGSSYGHEVADEGRSSADHHEPKRDGTVTMADPARNERDGLDRKAGCRRGVCEASEELGKPESERRREGRTEPAGQQGRPDAAEYGGAVANTRSAGRQGREQRRACTGNGGGGQKAHGPTEQLCGALPIFAPGPEDDRWAGIIEQFPHLEPATEPGVRGLVDGVPLVVDESRNHQLRAIGNGVVPLQAATAIVELFRRSGIKVMRP